MFVKLRKATISLVVSNPSTRNNSTPTGLIFMKFDIWVFFFFRKSVEKIQVASKSEKKKRVLYMNTNTHFRSNFVQLFSEWKNFQKKKLYGKSKHILCSITFFSKIVPFMRLIWKILYSRAGHRWQYGACALHAGYLRLQMHTLKLCNTHCFSTKTMAARTPLNVTLYVQYTACLVFLNSSTHWNAYSN